MSGRSLRRRMLGNNTLGRDIEKMSVAIHAIPLPATAVDHGGLGGLPDDDHPQYFNLAQNEIVVGQPTFSPTSPQAPFLLAANAQGQLVTGLRADQLSKSVIAGTGLITGGVLTADVTIDHDTGDLGDLHTNYAEHDQAESIVGPWSFITNTVTITWPAKLQFGAVGLIDTSTGGIVIAPATDLDLTPAGGDVKITAQVSIADTQLTPAYPLQIRSTTAQQLHVEYDADDYAYLSVASDGDLTIGTVTSVSGGNLYLNPVGDIYLDPTGTDVFPGTTYTVNLGSVIKKYLTLHVAELWVSTLVAQNVVSTIGGRIIVTPSTELITAINNSINFIQVKHNNLGDATGQDGDIVLMEAGGKLEFMVILVHETPDSGKIWKTVTGGYEYKVTRSHDPTGANAWDAGDAVVNTGQDGDGFIDMFSVQGVYGSDSGAGPTVVGNVRTGAAYNDFSEHWAIGNLNGLYGVGASDVYGVGLGRYGATFNHILIDDTNGIRFYEGTSTLIAQWDGTTITLGQGGSERLVVTPTYLRFLDDSGLVRAQLTGTSLTLGRTATEHIVVTPTALQFKDQAGIVQLELLGGGSPYLLVGDNAGGEYVRIDATNGIQMFTGGNRTIYIESAGHATFGRVAANYGNMRWNNTSKTLEFRGGAGGTIVQASIDTDGTIMAGLGAVKIGQEGIKLESSASYGQEDPDEITFYDDPMSGGFVTGGIQTISNREAGAGGYRNLKIYVNRSFDEAEAVAISMTHTQNTQSIILGGTYLYEIYLNANKAVYVDGNGLVVGDYDPGTAALGTIYTSDVIYIGAENSNANQTIGMTIDSGSAENEVFTLKTSGMTHDMTTITETDTYGMIYPWDSPLGGMTIAGLSDGAQVRGLSLLGYTQSQTTTHTTSTIGVVTLAAFDANGSGVQDLGTNGAILAIRNNATTRAIFVGDGRLFLNNTTLEDIPDYEDDGMLLHGLRASLQDPKTEFYKRNREFAEHARPVLERLGIIEYNDGPGEDGRAFIDVQGLQFLTIDAVRQLYDRMNRYESVLLDMGIDPKALGGLS